MNVNDLADSLDEQNEQQRQQQTQADQTAADQQNTDKLVKAVGENAKSMTEGLKNVKGEVKVTNPTDVSGVVDSINKLNLTTFMQNEGLPKLAQNLSDLSGKTQDLQDKLENEGLKKMSDQLGLVVKKLDEVSKTLSKTEVSVDAKLQKTIDNLSKSINAIDFKPSVNVAAPQTKVVATPVDLKPLLGALASVEQAIKDSEKEETEQDLTPITAGLSAVQSAITALRFPVPNYVLPFKDANGKDVQVNLDSAGNLPVAGEALTGTGTDTTLTLTSASTSYQVPASPPLSAYLLLLYNGSDTDMFITFTSATSGGVKLAAGANLNIDLGASQTVFAYCSGTGKVLNVSYKVI